MLERRRPRHRGGKDPETGELRYLAVNIVTPAESSNRAGTDDTETQDGSFEDGSKAEVAVDNALFILLEGSENNQKVSSTVQVNGADLKPWSDGTSGTVDKISSAVLVIQAAESKPAITGILAVLNPPSGLSFAAGTSLSDVKTKVDNYGAAGEGEFIMSNSAYVDGSNVKLAADLSGTGELDKYLAKTAEAAKNNPVDIYVERVVAKIRTNAVADITSQGDDKFNRGASVQLQGNPSATSLTIDIKGIEIANCAKKSYLFKNVDNFTSNAPFPSWSDVANHRSYWATVPDNLTYTNHTWNYISGVAEENGNASTAKLLTSKHDFYVQENVFTNNDPDVVPQHTSVIVTAQLKNGNDAFEFVKLAGVYYNPDDALTQLVGYLNNSGYRVKTTTTENGTTTDVYSTLDASEKPLKWCKHAPADATVVKGWQGFAEIKEEYIGSKSFWKWDSAANAYVEIQNPLETINKELKNEKYRAWKWTKGMCYYFVDIEHFGKKDDVYLKGIIRNHIYDLTLRSLGGLGVPVFDPSVDIIPERPDDDDSFYLAARINILQWKLVKQTIDFN